MAILGYGGLRAYASRRLISVAGAREGFQVASQNLHFVALYRAKKKLPVKNKQGVFLHGRGPLTQEQFIDGWLEQVPFTHAVEIDRAGQGTNRRYFALPEETIGRAAGIRGEVFDRSRSARVGFEVSAVDGFVDSVLNPATDYEGSPLCAIKTCTRVVLRPGDSISQLFFGTNGHEVVSSDEMKAMIAEGKLDITYVKRREKRVPLEELTFSKGLVLYRGSEARIYNGELIDPLDAEDGGKGLGYAFKTIRIPTTGLEVQPGQFVLTASRERVFRPSTFIMYVTMHDRDQIYAAVGASRSAIAHKGRVHLNAPWVLQDGAITFENSYRDATLIFPNEPQSELFLERLVGDVPKQMLKKSRFAHQQGPRTASGR